jgi:hypothetical protein
MQKIRKYLLGTTAITVAWLGSTVTAWAGNGLISPPTIDITNGTMTLDSGAGQTMNTSIQTWLSVVVVIAILGIGVNLAYHAWKMSHGDERTRADGTKGILNSIIAIIIVASLWLIISWAVGMV